MKLNKPMSPKTFSSGPISDTFIAFTILPWTKRSVKIERHQNDVTCISPLDFQHVTYMVFNLSLP